MSDSTPNIDHCSCLPAVKSTDPKDHSPYCSYTRIDKLEAEIIDLQELEAALERAQHDINWMLNNRHFLSGYVFDYIDKALNQQEGDCRE